MQIGTTNFDGSVKKEWFQIEANADNLYRVLPPLFSMADKGQYAKYYSVHSVWIKDPTNPTSKARPYKFQCIQKIDRESKMILNHCPFCDKATEQRGQYEAAKEKGLDADQLKTFLFAQVLPYQAEKKFYVNVVNLENKVGVLPLGIKCFRSLQDRLSEVRNNFNTDATGMQGLFFNFRKIQKFKGDRDTAYQVDLAQETFQQDGQHMSKPRVHVITEEFIKYLESSARDLGSMFKEISVTEIKSLVAVSDESKHELCQRIFAKSDKVTLETTVPNTNSTTVGNVTLTPSGVQVEMPQVQPAPASTVNVATPVTPVPLTKAPVAGAPAITAAVNPALAPVAPPASAPLAPPATATAPAAAPVVETLSEEDFVNTFMGSN